MSSTHGALTEDSDPSRPFLGKSTGPINNTGIDTKSELEATQMNEQEEDAPDYVPEMHSSDEEVTVHGSFAEDKKISPTTAVFNIINTIIGAGILALPNVMMNFGIIIGIIIFTLVSAMTYFSCLLLLRAKNNTGHTKYASIGVECFKKPGEVIIKIIIILNNFGLCVSYLLIFGKSMSKFIQDASEKDIFWTEKPVMIVVMCILIFPLIAAREFTKLKFSSWVCVGAVLVFCFVTTFNFAKKAYNEQLPDSYNWVPNADSFDYKNALSCFPTVFLAFTFQFNFFPVFKSVEAISDRKMLKISMAAILGCLIIYLYTAILGYISYGNKIKSNFLEVLTREDLGTPLFYIVLIAYSVNAALGFPIQYFSLRNNVISIIKDVKKLFMRKCKKNKGERKVENYRQTLLRKNIFFYTVTIVLYIIVIILGISVDNLGMVFAIIGAICANAISYILPAMFYVKVKRKKRYVFKLAIFLIVFGSIAGILSIIGEFLKFS